MADSGWIAVVGVLVGGGLAGTVGLLQARLQYRFDTVKAKEDREYKETTEQRAALMQVYTWYQLAADRLENAIRELTPTRLAATPERGMGASENVQPGKDFLEEFEGLLDRFHARGPGVIVSEWSRHSSFADGRQVEIADGMRVVNGVTRGLNPIGALRVETADHRIEEIYSGEVRNWK